MLAWRGKKPDDRKVEEEEERSFKKIKQNSMLPPVDSDLSMLINLHSGKSVSRFCAVSKQATFPAPGHLR